MSTNWTVKVTQSITKIMAGGFTVFGVAFRTGVEALDVASLEKTVTLTTAMPSTAYAVIPCLGNNTDTGMQILPLTWKVVSTTQFTVTWGVPLGSANYMLSYLIIGKNTA